VLIYRNDLMEKSETFIRSQVSSLRRYQGIYCGLGRRMDGILPDDAPQILLETDHGPRTLRALVRRRIFMATGFAPEWHERCRAAHPLLLHAHFGIDGATALPIQAKLDVPLIISLHGYDVTTSDEAMRGSSSGRLYLRRRQELFARTELFICVSRFIRDQAIERGYPPEKLWVHSIGIDINMFKTVESGERQPIVVFVGRLVEKKGCTHLIGAMRSVQQAMPSARLVVIGDGPLRQKLEMQAARTLSGGYTFMGAQSPDVVHSWLRKAQVFCVPSITAGNGDREGLGIVFCEAQAMGLPVASFASGGIPEAVMHGETGFLSAEKDEIGLAQNICRLMKDRELWAEMSAGGQQRMKQHFNLRLQTAMLESQYDQVVEVSRRKQELAAR
jgi:colanic acid/amylovoran biosynthesis glycosyltransferase